MEHAGELERLHDRLHDQMATLMDELEGEKEARVQDRTQIEALEEQLERERQRGAEHLAAQARILASTVAMVERAARIIGTTKDAVNEAVQQVEGMNHTATFERMNEAVEEMNVAVSELLLSESSGDEDMEE